MSDQLADYIEVGERIAEFYARHPDGSHQGKYEIIEVADQTLIVYKATVYRTPDDQRPSIAYASEPIPGRTPFTKGSELMNAETSAVGRALAMLGFKVKRSVASAEEVRAATEQAKPITSDRAKFILAALRGNKLTLKQVALTLGSVGIDAPRANSSKALTERIESLTDEEATRLEAKLNG